MTNPTPDATGLPELPAADLTGYRDNVAECVFEATTPTPDDAVRWYTAAQMHAYARAALSARPLPSDWVAVPREATDAMLSAWLTSSEKAGGKSGGDFAPWSRAIRCYRAMLAAAPSAPAEGGECNCASGRGSEHCVVHANTVWDQPQTAPEPLAQGDVFQVLHGLVIQWKDNATHSDGGQWDEGHNKGLIRCANALATAITTLASTKLYASPQPAAEGRVLARGWFHALPEEDDYEFHDDASGAGKGCAGCIRAMIVPESAAVASPPQPSASVSERARALLADEYERNGHLERAAIVRGQALHPDSLDAIHLRALEQALTQQRGESIATPSNTGGEIERCEKCGRDAVHYLVMDNLPQPGRRMPFCSGCTMEHEYTAQEVNDHEMRNFGGAYGLVTFHYEPLDTTPQPSADAVREGLTDEDVAVLRRLKAALPTVGLNGWMTGVRVLTKLESLLGRGG